MVFGNLGADCATGVVFTRDPATGERRLSGEYLNQRAGRGRRRRHPAPPQPLLASPAGDGDSLEELMPEAQHELAEACERLERHFADMQDIEFTVQQGRLWVLQTRSGKRNRPGRWSRSPSTSSTRA